MWSEDEVATLRELWTKGWSASRIAAKTSGKTRNAVIGKAHRLGLKARKSPITYNPHSKNRRLKKRRERLDEGQRILSSPVLVFDTPVYEVVSEPLAMEPEGVWGCQWIESDPSFNDACKCNARRVLGKPYCPDHVARAYTPRPKKQAEKGAQASPSFTPFQGGLAGPAQMSGVRF